MKKLLLGSIFVLLLSWMSLYRGETVIADDPVPTPTVDPKVLTRDRVHAFCDPATNPREARGDFIDCTGATQPNQPTPTQAPGGGANPTPTERPGGGVGPTSTPVPSSGGGGGGDSGGGGGGGGGSSSSTNVQPTPVKPRVKGLSRTSSSNYGVFDIMLLSGVLCLLLYVWSKSAATKRLAPKAVVKGRRRYRRS